MWLRTIDLIMSDHWLLITVWPGHAINYCLAVPDNAWLCAKPDSPLHPEYSSCAGCNLWPGPCRYLDSINGVSSHEQSTTCVTINGINEGNKKTIRYPDNRPYFACEILNISTVENDTVTKHEKKEGKIFSIDGKSRSPSGERNHSFDPFTKVEHVFFFIRTYVYAWQYVTLDCSMLRNVSRTRNAWALQTVESFSPHIYHTAITHSTQRATASSV